MCSTSTLFLLLSDLFDTISLDNCEEVFSFVEQRVSLWKLVSYMHSVTTRMVMVMALDGQHKWGSTPSFTSVVDDEERMRPRGQKHSKARPT